MLATRRAGNSPRQILAAALAAATLAAPTAALGHWCDDLWGSGYNVVVRPVSDTVDVPATGSASFDVYVQNNMAYPLYNFALEAEATGYTITLSSQAPKVSGFLMPGEKLKHTLSISKSGGATLPVEQIAFYVGFGNNPQDHLYYRQGRDVVVKKTTGSIVPVNMSFTPNFQAEHIWSAAKADFSSLGTGLDELMAEYCVGRGSWSGSDGSPIGSYNCSNPSSQTCPGSTTSRGDTKYDYQHLWAAEQLAARKSALGTRLPVLRARLQCGWNDSMLTFKATSALLLGYLGEDPTARTFLEGKISSGSADEKAIAKASLILFNKASDITAYHADVTSNMSSGTDQVAMVSAAALGILDKDDAAVTNGLLPRAQWIEPDTSDAGRAMMAAHLVDLAAWDRRGWAANADDVGQVSFYGGVDNTPPQAPAGVACTASAGGTVRVTWNAVTQDTSGGPESVARYRIYDGIAARPGGATHPGEMGFDYDHVNSATGLYLDLPSLPGTSLHYFAVTAEDTAGNASVYSAEVSCLPIYKPVASLSCTPLSGTAPLAVSCDGSASSDPNGAADLAGTWLSLDGAAETAGPTASYNFPAAGTHTVMLRVADKGGLQDTKSASITVNPSGGGNQPPTAVADGNPKSGAWPLLVTFSSAGSSDPDAGQVLSYSWDFADGSAASTSANPTHTFGAAGTYQVKLTVTDNGTPPLSGVAVVVVTTTDPLNHPPDLTSASASPLFGAVPLAVHFDGTGVTDPDGDAMTLTWDFGDGTAKKTGTSADHSYPTAGTFTATLSAQDNGTPAIGPATKSFTVNAGVTNRPPDAANATVLPASGAAPLKVTLDASKCTDPDGDALTVRWTIPTSTTDSTTKTDKTTDWTFPTAGDWEITLTLSDGKVETTKKFPVKVTGTGGAGTGTVVGGTGCACSAPGVGLLALLGLAFRRRR